MALSNKQRIGQALDELKPALLAYILPVLEELAKGPRKWEVEQAVQESEVRMTGGKINWDVQALLRVMIKLWGGQFSNDFDRFERARIRSLLAEANDIRNRHAHEQPFSYADTYRDLDTISRVCQAVKAEEAALKVSEMAKAVMRVQFDEDRRSESRRAAAMEGTPLAALKPWRQVVAPHTDVAKGNFLEAEFVADLHAVHTGKATTEYGDPKEFFARTFLTEGLKDLLRRSLTRLHSKGGSPVLELKTNFGGGKTHSLLALYHLCGTDKANQLAGLDSLLKEVEVTGAPSTKRVVIAGHQLGVNQPRRKDDGTIVKTLWGELAHQLGSAAAYEKIRSSDEAGTNPGAEVLAELMRDAGPCLILIDEWVAYLRETVDMDGLAAGSFESNFGFAQSLTEAAKVVPHALVVASLPASQIEMGGPKGVSAFNQLSNLFQRVATPWQPTRTEEGYEIVRRRLFESSMDYPGRDAVVKAFYEQYTSAKSSYPANASEQEYKRKLEACYPIHPELFDKLDSVWSTLEKFQKTRGVLRFMAAVISELWQRDDRNLLIMPASVALDSPRITSVIKEVLPNGGSWDGVISSDIDGQASVSHLIDSENQQSLGKYSACRRVARSIFIAGAPTSGPNRGVDHQHMLLACVQPGENGEKFGDALRRLSDRATYLYRDASRSWFALQPSILRLAQDRTKDFLESDQLDPEIVRRLRKWEGRRSFPGGTQVAQIPADVPDEIATRLVILPPTAATGKTLTNTSGLLKAEEILTQAANRPRTHRNGLVFLVPDETQLAKLRESTALYLAWKSITENEESLELTSHDKTQATNKLQESGEMVERRLGETWSHILVPVVKDPASSVITWSDISDTSSADKVPMVLDKLKKKELVMDKFSAFYLKRALDSYLWGQADHISTRAVADAFGTYLYFPRLLEEGLLLDAIYNGFGGDTLLCEFFGYAEGYDPTAGKYLGLHTTTPPHSATIGESLLIRPDVAMAQVAPPKPSVEPANGGNQPDYTNEGIDPGIGSGGGSTPPPAPPALKTRFYGSIDLNQQKVASSVQKVVDEVVQHLVAKYGTNIRITLDIEADNAEGFDESVVRTVSENANTLGFSQKGFE
jgi:predicted AAA+ superfamily ATPase